MSIVVTIDERDSSQAEREALYSNGLVGRALDELAFVMRASVTVRVLSNEAVEEDDGAIGVTVLVDQ